MKWKLHTETGMLKGKPIPVYYVAPEGEKYGYATFIDQKAAIQYRDQVNRELP